MFARYASAITTGTLITLALLYAMQGLIDLQPGAQGDDPAGTPVKWARLPPPTPPPPRQVLNFDKDTLTRPPVPPTGRPQSASGTGLKIPIGPTGPTPIDPRPARISDPDGPLISIVRVQPTYPAVAQVKGLEGWVDVRFDVMANGQVTNIVVTGSSNRVFETAAIRAAQKFRFKAPVVNGVPQVASGVDYRFRFEMAD